MMLQGSYNGQIKKLAKMRKKHTSLITFFTVSTMKTESELIVDSNALGYIWEMSRKLLSFVRIKMWIFIK